MVTGMSGESGKDERRGVPRFLDLARDADRLTLTPRTSSGRRGRIVIVDLGEFQDAVRSGQPTTFHGSAPTGGARRVLVNRPGEDAPHDRGRAYIWIEGPGDHGGWDFLCDRAELMDALDRLRPDRLR